MAKKRIVSYENVPIDIDGDSITIQVKRLSIEEHATFDRMFWRGVLSESDRLVLVRRPGEELARTEAPALTESRLAALQAQVETLAESPEDLAAAYTKARTELTKLVADLTPGSAFVVSDEEIRRRRLVEMTEEQRASYERLRMEDVQAYASFLDEAIGQYIRIPAGEVSWVDADTNAESDVITGKDFARCFGARAEVLQQVALAIRSVNQLSDLEKNDWRSRFASRPSSTGRGQTATGASPDRTVGRADPSGSATSAGATPTAASPSGATES